MQKNKFVIASGLTLLGVLGGYVVYLHDRPLKQQEIAASRSTENISMYAQYENDFSDDKVLIGGFHHVFVGKVLAQKGIHYMLPDAHRGLETEYLVHVLQNIKGKLSGDVTVAQSGGIENGRIIAMEGDIESSARDGSTSPLLQPGSTYLLATRGDGKEGYYMLGTNPYAKKLISTDSNLSNVALLALVASNPRVLALQVAYPIETPMKEDVLRKFSINSFQSLPANEKALVQEHASEALRLLPPPPQHEAVSLPTAKTNQETPSVVTHPIPPSTPAPEVEITWQEATWSEILTNIDQCKIKSLSLLNIVAPGPGTFAILKDGQALKVPGIPTQEMIDITTAKGKVKSCGFIVARD